MKQLFDIQSIVKAINQKGSHQADQVNQIDEHFVTRGTTVNIDADTDFLAHLDYLKEVVSDQIATDLIDEANAHGCKGIHLFMVEATIAQPSSDIDPMIKIGQKHMQVRVRVKFTQK